MCAGVGGGLTGWLAEKLVAMLGHGWGRRLRLSPLNSTATLVFVYLKASTNVASQAELLLVAFLNFQGNRWLFANLSGIYMGGQ